MDVLRSIGEFWLRHRADPSATAMAAVEGLTPATVITGGSEGLGFELARCIAAESRVVVLVARSQEVRDAAASLQTAYPRSTAIGEVLDVASPEAPAQLDALLARHGLYLDVLVNNAAVGLGGEFSDLDPAALDLLVATNVAALTRLTRHYLPAMRARCRGGILNLSSLAAFTPGPWQAPYFASKAYVLSLTAAIGAECAGEGVRVCAFACGPIETAIHGKMRTESTIYRAVLPSTSPERMAKIAWRSYRLGRRIVVPGIVTGMLAALSRVVPHELLLPIVRALMRPRLLTRPTRSRSAPGHL